jgi:hypothetical protein
LSDCPPLLSAHFLAPATGTCQAARGAAVERELRNRPATGNQALQDRGSTFRQSERRGGAVPGERLVLLGLLTSRPHFGGFVATAPVRNGIVRRCCRRRTPKRCARLGYPPQNPWRTGEVLAVSGNRQSRSPLCAARHDYRGRASGVGPATNRYGRRLRRLVRRVRAECAACGVRGCPGAGRCRCGENCSHHCGGIPRANQVLEEAEVLSSASGVHVRLSPEISVSPGTGSRG